MDAVKEFFGSGRLLKHINATTLILLPKGENPKTIKEYRPLACCNVLMKIITKVIASRIKRVLQTIISPVQGAFMEERSLNHNVSLCQELLHKYGREGISPRCFMEIDIHKAYDSVN